MKRSCLGALALLILAGCASRAVREPPSPLVDFRASAEVKQTWEVDFGSGNKAFVRLAPKLGNGAIYAADREGRVSAFAADSGRRLWENELRVPVTGGVGIGDGLVLLGTRRGLVIALERASGKQAWTSAVSSEVLAPPAMGSGVVVVQTVDGRVFGLAADDGKRLWVYERSEPALSLRGTDSPAIAGDMAIAGFASGKLVALALQDGRVLWEATVGQPRGRNEIERLVDVDAAPLVLPDAIYAASYQGKLVALNPRGGAVMWARDVSTSVDLAADSDNIYLADENGSVLAFNRHTGASLWKQEALRGRRLNAPVVYGEHIVVADYEGYVHWLARDDGRFIARHRVGRGPILAPATSDGETLFIAGYPATLAALRLRESK